MSCFKLGKIEHLGVILSSSCEENNETGMRLVRRIASLLVVASFGWIYTNQPNEIWMERVGKE